MKPINYISDCHGAPVTDLDGNREKGICEQCKQECWACDPEMLKPISIEQVIESVNNKQLKNKNDE